MARFSYLPAALALVAGCSGAWIAARATRDAERLRVRGELRHIADIRARDLELRLAAGTQVLHAVRAFYDSSQVVDRDEFTSFTAPFLSAHAEVQAIEWVPCVPAEKRAEIESRARSEGLGGFAIRERDVHGALVEAGERPVYFPVLYAEPRALNERSWGFDLGSSAVRRVALDRARDGAHVVTSNPLSLVQDASRSAGVLLLVPVYAREAEIHDVESRRRAIRGFAVGVLRIETLVEATLLRDPDALRGMTVSLLDPAAPETHRELFAQAVQSPAAGAAPIDAHVRVGDRSWRVQFTPDPAAAAAIGVATANLVLGVGVAMSLLLCAHLVRSVRGRERVDRLVRERTAQLRSATEHLREQARELTRTNDDLVEKNAELADFAYVASHDLQEPLRKLVSFSSMLERDLGQDLPPRAAEDVHFIVDAALRMKALVEDLLALTRAGRRPLVCDPVSLDVCLDGALACVTESMESSGAEIVRGALPGVVGDRSALTDVLEQLLHNALKFARKDVPPVVRITGERLDGRVVVSVMDNGIGIKPEYLGAVFAPFRRLHGRAEYEGTGIGLAVCRRIVVRHGGRIWAESVVDGGTTFKFELADSDEVQDEHYETQRCHNSPGRG